MINWILQLMIIILEFASTSMCNVHRVDINYKREIKNSKLSKTIVDRDGKRSKFTKKMKGIVSSTKLSKSPKNLKDSKGIKASKKQKKATETPTETPSVSVTQTSSVTPTQTSSVTPTQTSSVTPTQTSSVTPTQTSSVTPTQTPSGSPTQTPTQNPSVLSWVQMGADIDGEAYYDKSGDSVSLSDDGTVVAVGASGNDGSSGHVRIFFFDTTAWVQMGADIDGEAENDISGYSVSLSNDGTVVAVGAIANDGNGMSS